jgi:hypothetical protein
LEARNKFPLLRRLPGAIGRITGFLLDKGEIKERATTYPYVSSGNLLSPAEPYFSVRFPGSFWTVTEKKPDRGLGNRNGYGNEKSPLPCLGIKFTD